MASGFIVEHVFSISSILGRSFSILLRKPGVFFGLSALGMIPTFFVEMLDPEAAGLILTGTVIDVIVSFLLQAGLAYATYKTLRGEDVSLTETVSAAWPHLGPLTGVAVLTGLGILAGLACLIIPGLILASIWAVTMPACVMERLGVLDSISRSADLTKHYRLPIFVVLFLVMLITLLFVLVDLFFDDGSITVAGSLFSAFLMMPSTALEGVVAAVIYYDLRAVKEGLDLEHLAQVFD